MRSKSRIVLLLVASTQLLNAQLQITPLPQFDGVASDPTLSPDPGSSPDGKSIALLRTYSHYDDELVTHPLTGGPELDFGKVCWTGISWSPDSRFLVASQNFSDFGYNDCRLTLYSAANGHRISQLARFGSYPAFSPDRKTIAFADHKILKLLRLTPAGPVRTLATEPNEITGVFWSPDGKEILYQSSGDGPYFARISPDPGAKPRRLPEMESQLNITQILPNGDALATEVLEPSATWRVDLQASPVKVETAPFPDRVPRVSVTMRTGSPQIMLTGTDGKQERPFVNWKTADEDPVRGGLPTLVGWSPDSKSLYASQGYNLENPTPSNPLVRIDVADGKITQIAPSGIWSQLSRDSKFLYFFKTPYSELWRIELPSGTPELLAKPTDFNFIAYAVGARYIYLVREQTHVLVRFDPTARLSTDLTNLSFDPRAAELSPDERYLYFLETGNPHRRAVRVKGLF